MVKKQRMVTIADLKNLKRFRAKVKKGLVFMIEDDTQAEKTCRNEMIMNYVSRLHPFVSSEACYYIYNLWKDILTDDVFSNEFNVKKCDCNDEFNHYFVMKIVGILYEKEIYMCKNKKNLHDCLENTKCRTKYYSSLSMGLKRHLFVHLDKLIIRAKEKVEFKTV